ncbi:LPD1 domain-containing protein [Pseudopedobacter beijingensis]|uniref:LPD1 domain-containing protein n=1 Tax=Pseudopedobacter beijingensis TaxID=1207056 RepID=A0ABW4IH02_9SPHI
MAASKKATKKPIQNKKIGDQGAFTPAGSMAERYWSQKGIRTFINAPVKTNFNPGTAVLSKFKLKGIEFGNWVTIEDRWNYLKQLSISLNNLNKVLDFGNNIGLQNTLTVSFGARGKGQALAHYEPHTDVINLTRYKKGTPDALKEVMFTLSGGFGSYAHEYGHFLDYFFGKYIHQDKSSPSLSNGRSVRPVIENNYKSGSLRYLMFNVMDTIMWKPGKPKLEKNGVIYERNSMTLYYKKLRTLFALDEYWLRNNEIFARAFEQYILYKLKQKRLKDPFLSQVKYDTAVYMSPTELKAIVKPMDTLIKAMAKYAKMK